MGGARGVGGRVVPGAEPVSNTQATTTYGKKKKKRGKKAQPKAIYESEPESEAEDEAPTDANNPYAKLMGMANGDVPSEDEALEDATTYEDAVSDQHGLKDDLPSEVTNGVPPPIKEAPAEAEYYSEDSDSEEINLAESRRHELAESLSTHAPQPWNNLPGRLRNRVIDHLYNHKYKQDNDEWKKELRQFLWRAVIRPTYSWVNPDTGLSIIKVKPVEFPDGVHAMNHDLFVTYAAKKSDRIGRDLPTPEYVMEVEAQLRCFLQRCEKKGLGGNLEHLAVVLSWDEVQQRTLTKEDVQLRIAMVLKGVEFEWKGCEMFKPLGKNGSEWEEKSWSPDVVDKIWREVVAKS